MRELQATDAEAASPLDGFILTVLRVTSFLLLAPVLVGVLVRLALGPGNPGMAGFVAILTAVALSPGLAFSAVALAVAQRLGWRIHRPTAIAAAALVAVLVAGAIWMPLLSLPGALMAVASVLIAAFVIMAIGPRRARGGGLLMIGGVAIAGPFAVGQALIGLSYPVVTVDPEVIGRIEATRSDADEWPAWFAILEDRDVRLEPHEDRVLSQASEGDLLLFGTEPERWFMGARPSDDERCYLVSATKGWDEPDAVTLIYQRWPSIGIRLPKSSAFDAENRITHDPDGRPQYDNGGGGMTFCADEHGRLHGLWP